MAAVIGIGTRVRPDAGGLPAKPRHRVATITASRSGIFVADCCAFRLSVCRHSERLLSRRRTPASSSERPRRAQDISFAEMSRRQLELGSVVASDPGVATVGMAVGATGNQTQNNGRMFITLKPRDERDRLGDRDHPPAARRKLATGRGRGAVPAAGAGHQCRRPADADAIPIHAAGCRPRRAQSMGAEAL